MTLSFTLLHFFATGMHILAYFQAISSPPSRSREGQKAQQESFCRLFCQFFFCSDIVSKHFTPPSSSHYSLTKACKPFRSVQFLVKVIDSWFASYVLACSRLVWRISLFTKALTFQVPWAFGNVSILFLIAKIGISNEPDQIFFILFKISVQWSTLITICKSWFPVYFEFNLFSFQNLSQDYPGKEKCESAMKYIEKSRFGDKQFVRSLWNWLRWKAFFAAPTQRYLGQWWIICQLFQGMLLRWLSRDANFDPKIRSASTNWGYFGPNLARIKD